MYDTRFKRLEVCSPHRRFLHNACTFLCGGVQEHPDVQKHTGVKSTAKKYYYSEYLYLLSACHNTLPIHFPDKSGTSMMLRVRTFLVEALLLSVTSAQRCSVCGAGYMVGRPSGSTSICFPKLSDSTCSCHDLELAGLQGLIPIEECQTIPQMISETCYCRDSSNIQNTDESTNSLHGTSYSTVRSAKSWFSSSAPVSLPPIALESFYPSVSAVPVVAPYYYYPTDTAETFRPAKTSSPSVTTPAGPQFSPFVIIQWLICISLVLGFSYFVYIFAEPICGEHCRCFGAMVQNSTAIPVRTSPMLSNTDASGRRPHVLEVMFPNEGFHQVSMGWRSILSAVALIAGGCQQYYI